MCTMRKLAGALFTCLVAGSFLPLTRGDVLVAGGEFSSIGPFSVPSFAKFNGWFWDDATTRTPLSGAVYTGCKSGSVTVLGGSFHVGDDRDPTFFLRTSTWYFARGLESFFSPQGTLRPTTHGHVANAGEEAEEEGILDGEALDFGSLDSTSDEDEDGEGGDTPVEPVERALSGEYAYSVALSGPVWDLYCTQGSVLLAGAFQNATIPPGATSDDVFSAADMGGGPVGVWVPGPPARFVLLGEPGQVTGSVHAVAGPSPSFVVAGGYFTGSRTASPTDSFDGGASSGLASLAQWSTADGWRSVGGGALLPLDTGANGTLGEVYAIAYDNTTGWYFVGGHMKVCAEPGLALTSQQDPACFPHLALRTYDEWSGPAGWAAPLNGSVTALLYRQTAASLLVGGAFLSCGGRSQCTGFSAVRVDVSGLLGGGEAGFHLPGPHDVVPCGGVSAASFFSGRHAVGGAFALLPASVCAQAMASLEAVLSSQRGLDKQARTAVGADAVASLLHLQQAAPGNPHRALCSLATWDNAAAAWTCLAATEGTVYALYAYGDGGERGFITSGIVGASIGMGLVVLSGLCWAGAAAAYALRPPAKRGSTATRAPRPSGTSSTATPSTQLAAPLLANDAAGGAAAGGASKSRSQAPRQKVAKGAWAGLASEAFTWGTLWACIAGFMAFFDLCVVLPVGSRFGSRGAQAMSAALFTRRQWSPQIYVDLVIGMSLCLPALSFLGVMAYLHWAPLYPNLPASFSHRQPRESCIPRLRKWQFKQHTPRTPKQVASMHQVLASRVAPTVAIVSVCSIWCALFLLCAAFAPAPVALQQLHPTWGAAAYSVGLVIVSQICEVLISQLYAPVMSEFSTLAFRISLRACLTLAQASLLSLNPASGASALLTPLFSNALDFVMLAATVAAYRGETQRDPASGGGILALLGRLVKASIGFDAEDPIATMDALHSARIVRLAGCVLDLFMLSGYTLVCALQIALLLAMDAAVFKWIVHRLPSPRQQVKALLTQAAETEASLQEHQPSLHTRHAPSDMTQLPPSAASHSSLSATDVRALHVLSTLLALSLSGLCSAGQFVALGGVPWLPPAAAAGALALLGFRRAGALFMRPPPEAMHWGTLLVLVLFVGGWLVLDALCLTVGFAHSFSITTAAPLLSYAVVLHGALVVTVFALCCCKPGKGATTPLNRRRVVRVCGCRLVDPLHTMYRYTRSRDPGLAALLSS